MVGHGRDTSFHHVIELRGALCEQVYRLYGLSVNQNRSVADMFRLGEEWKGRLGGWKEFVCLRGRIVVGVYLFGGINGSAKKCLRQTNLATWAMGCLFYQRYLQITYGWSKINVGYISWHQLK